MTKKTSVACRTSLLFFVLLSCSLIAETKGKAMGLSRLPNGGYLGLDRNLYPGDATLPAISKRFAFIGYWLNSPPGTQSNSWLGKRGLLKEHNLGFLVLWNGRLDREILAKMASGTSAAALGIQDAKDAVLAAKREGFPIGAILFLDQEEGGRLTKEQADYLFAWTGGVTAGGFRSGAYVSGQPAPDGPGKTITTAQNIKDTVSAKHLHPIALFVAQDSTPPSKGCTVTPPPLSASGTPGAIAWQFSQSPRRSVVTQAYQKTYAMDGNCYVPELPGVLLDLDLAEESDPSKGR